MIKSLTQPRRQTCHQGVEPDGNGALEAQEGWEQKPGLWRGRGVAHWVLTGLLPKSKRHASVSHWLFIKVPSAHFAKTLWTDCLKFEL